MVIGGRRVKTIDVHTHCYVLEVMPLVEGHEWGSLVRAAAAKTRGIRLTPDVIGPERVQWMDEHGIDVQVLSINPYWHTAERELATRLIAVQNEALAAACAKFPGRFVGFASVAMQHPDLAARQLEDAMKMGMPGAALACNVAGDELANPRFDPFWVKVEELSALIFIHPQPEGRFNGKRYPAGMDERLSGYGNLGNTIGNPLETTIAFSHLIFEGTLDKFPGLRICGGHGGGFLPSYVGRSDALASQGCRSRPRDGQLERYRQDRHSGRQPVQAAAHSAVLRRVANSDYFREQSCVIRSSSTPRSCAFESRNTAPARSCWGRTIPRRGRSEASITCSRRPG